MQEKGVKSERLHSEDGQEAKWFPKWMLLEPSLAAKKA
jgi:hypothetical protein